MDADNGSATWDVYLELSYRAGGILGRVQYNKDVFTEVTIARTMQDFEALLRWMTVNIDRRVSESPEFC
jgi:hypothetical protein